MKGGLRDRITNGSSIIAAEILMIPQEELLQELPRKKIENKVLLSTLMPKKSGGFMILRTEAKSTLR